MDALWYPNTSVLNCFQTEGDLRLIVRLRISDFCRDKRWAAKQKCFFPAVFTKMLHSTLLYVGHLFSSHSTICWCHGVKFIGSVWLRMNWRRLSNDKANGTCEISTGDMSTHWAERAKEEKATLFIGTERWPCYARLSAAPHALPLVLAEQRMKRQGCLLYLGDLC